MKLMDWLYCSKRYRLLLAVLLTLLSLSLITRLVLVIISWNQLTSSVSDILIIFLIGFLFDLINSLYFLIPITIVLWLVPNSVFQKKWFGYVQYIFFFISSFILLFTTVAEYFFWDEFNTRFNFIAVDYLVYTTEVIGNIRQSYPIEWIIGVALMITVLLTWSLRSYLNSNNNQALPVFKQRSAFMVIWTALALVAFVFVSVRLHHFSVNQYANELAGNGMYELFAAYRNNELDYEQFYPHVSNLEAVKLVQSKFAAKSTHSNQQVSIAHQIHDDEPENKMNVVLISVESLSAQFLSLFGNNQRITPNLDSLVQHSLVFTNLYATGTRTVRGLEALTLSVPPTPGQSIVRRPNNEHLFTLGSVFRSKGYQCKYIYGGYSYFDNMNYFFSENGYEVVDRTAIPEAEIEYENIWGVADEDLFDLSLREIDQTLTNNQPAFVHIMTTSNHRPFTYPEGRIDIPSHTNREGAVKYTDYAIGKFLRDAGAKSWFNNTLFIIVADHCASSAGKVELPVKKYKIPMFIFAPGKVAPQINNHLMSQIDVAPTILGLLNFSYESKFYGYDIFKVKQAEERAFISTYQNLGYLKHDSMIVLMPLQKPELRLLNREGEPIATIKQGVEDLKITKEAISWYQSASLAFKSGLMKE
jgi:phosphoglycerol transferase MdoB-like AlkP superfamily enzyme